MNSNADNREKQQEAAAMEEWHKTLREFGQEIAGNHWIILEEEENSAHHQASYDRDPEILIGRMHSLKADDELSLEDKALRVRRQIEDAKAHIASKDYRLAQVDLLLGLPNARWLHDNHLGIYGDLLAEMYMIDSTACIEDGKLEKAIDDAAKAVRIMKNIEEVPGNAGRPAVKEKKVKAMLTLCLARIQNHELSAAADTLRQAFWTLPTMASAEDESVTEGAVCCIIQLYHALHAQKNPKSIDLMEKYDGFLTSVFSCIPF